MAKIVIQCNVKMIIVIKHSTSHLFASVNQMITFVAYFFVSSYEVKIVAQNITEIFGQRLRQLRESRNFTQAQLAKIFNISRTTLGYYESAERTPDIVTLDRIAKFFEVPLDYLMGYNDAQKKENSSACDNLGISEKSAENVRAITQSGGNVDILLESDVFSNIVELLNKIKTKTVIKLFDHTRTLQIDEIGKLFCNSNKQMLKFILENYAYSVLISVSQATKECGCSQLKSEDQVIIWEYCLLQREMRKLLDDIESDKPEYKDLFAEYDNSTEEHLKKTLVEKENELCNSTAGSNKELEQNIKALKQLIDFYHEHIRKDQL